MAQDEVEKMLGVRTPVAASPETTRRTLDERVFIRFPALVRALGLVAAAAQLSAATSVYGAKLAPIC